MGLSNVEDILQAGLEGTDLPRPESRIAELLKEWIEQGGSGGFTPTTAQLAAMNSGITAEKLQEDENNISTLQEQVGYAISELEGVL